MTKTTAARIGLYALAAATLLLPQTGRAQTQPPPPGVSARDGSHDFDFLIGDWKAHLKQLVDPLPAHQMGQYEGPQDPQDPGSNANWEVRGRRGQGGPAQAARRCGSTIRPPSSGTST